MAHIANCMRRTVDRTDSVYIMEETLATSPTVSQFTIDLNLPTADKHRKERVVSKRECSYQVQPLAASTEDASRTVEPKSAI